MNTARLSKPARSCLTLVAVALLSLALTGCVFNRTNPAGDKVPAAPYLAEGSMPELAHSDAERLLRQHSLHPIGAPETAWQGRLDLGEPMFAGFKEASTQARLDLAAHEGEVVQVHAVPLKERCQSEEGTVTAEFIVSKTSLVGAGLSLGGYLGGVTALDDRSQFAVPGFEPDNLVFDGVRRADIAGPWTGADWERRTTLDEPARQQLLAALRDLQPKPGYRSGVPGDEEYLVLLTWEDGAEVRARLTQERGSKQPFLTFDYGGFQDLHFVPAVQLMQQARSELHAR